ncbi:hypothetical protein COHA_006557 [Chlorella ohadii]|uniref:EF-hand domain-containing protein n=1 Tax=Chlorella ohadii TaxID=2649997 RepID=A0AAD5DNS5_9CHLO|nr:hypothetical protein COHA_006557 [Chlorella ohadii]
MPLTATELAHCRRAFLVFDRNSDGVIDADELRAALVTLGHPAPSDVALQVIEAQKAQQVARGGEADTVAAFVALGGQPDKGGQVSVERLARTLAAFDLRIDLDRLLAEMDVDANGSVSYDEFKALLAGTAQLAKHDMHACACVNVKGLPTSGLMLCCKARAGLMAPRRALLLALAAALAVCAAAELPASFANQGPPRFLSGLQTVFNESSTEVEAVGFVLNGTFSFTYLDASHSGLATHTGRYLSWECQGDNGTYLALVELTIAYSDGTEEGPMHVCEFGIYSAVDSYLRWARSPDECPDQDWPLWMNTLYREGQEAEAVCGEPDVPPQGDDLSADGGDGHTGWDTLEAGSPSPAPQRLRQKMRRRAA